MPQRVDDVAETSARSQKLRTLGFYASYAEAAVFSMNSTGSKRTWRVAGQMTARTTILCSSLHAAGADDSPVLGTTSGVAVVGDADRRRAPRRPATIKFLPTRRLIVAAIEPEGMPVAAVIS